MALAPASALCLSPSASPHGPWRDGEWSTAQSSRLEALGSKPAHTSRLGAGEGECAVAAQHHRAKAAAPVHRHAFTKVLPPEAPSSSPQTSDSLGPRPNDHREFPCQPAGLRRKQAYEEAQSGLFMQFGLA